MISRVIARAHLHAGVPGEAHQHVGDAHAERVVDVPQVVGHVPGRHTGGQHDVDRREEDVRDRALERLGRGRAGPGARPAESHLREQRSQGADAAAAAHRTAPPGSDAVAVREPRFAGFGRGYGAAARDVKQIRAPGVAPAGPRALRSRAPQPHGAVPCRPPMSPPRASDRRDRRPPNVGKSTLFNRFAGSAARWSTSPASPATASPKRSRSSGRRVLVVDTAGLDPEAEAGLAGGGAGPGARRDRRRRRDPVPGRRPGRPAAPRTSELARTLRRTDKPIDAGGEQDRPARGTAARAARVPRARLRAHARRLGGARHRRLGRARGAGRAAARTAQAAEPAAGRGHPDRGGRAAQRRQELAREPPGRRGARRGVGRARHHARRRRRPPRARRARISRSWTPRGCGAPDGARDRPSTAAR